MKRRTDNGFTLMEIMLVVVIIGIIAALFVPNIVGRSDQARRAAVANDLRGIGATLDLYRLDNAHYPSTDQGLEALVSKPNGLPDPMNYNPGGYARKVPDRTLGKTSMSTSMRVKYSSCTRWVPTARRAAKGLRPISTIATFDYRTTRYLTPRHFGRLPPLAG